ncbi:MAG: ice-binding family protein [Gaiellales bacterium]
MGSQHVHELIGNGLRGMGLLVLALLVALALVSSAQAQTVSLGTDNAFAVLGASTVTNTGPSVINGDLGVSPGTAVTGFPPGIVNGTIHAADAVALQAQSDLTTAYNDAAGRACGTVLTGTDLGGLTLTSGVYCFSSSAQLTGTLTLDFQGNANAVFIFQIGSTLTTASSSSVNFINGGSSCNVFWQVGSSATIGTTTTFRGNILALTSITATTSATVDGRLLARNGAVTLDSNVVTRTLCAAPPAAPDVTGPTVTIGGAPGLQPCIATDFRLRIRARDPSRIRRVDVFLDGRLIKRTTQSSFFVWIRAARLVAARHTIRVVALDRAGNRTVTTRRFRRCDRPVFPNFTG